MKKINLQTMIRPGTNMHLYLVPLLAIITLSSILGQAPASFNYQAVLRNGSGEINANMDVSVQINIVRGEPTGTIVFTETHNVTTNGFGLVNLKIGSLETASFTAIDWANGPYFIKLEVDGIEMGISHLSSVPYALYADYAGNAFSGNYNDLSNKPDLGDFIVIETDPTWNGSNKASGSIGRTGNVGIGIDKPDALLHAYGTGTGEGNVLFQGSSKSSPGDPPASGHGTRMMWYPDKGAFRAGFVHDSNWDKDSIGRFSVAMGYNTKAKGHQSVSLGENTIASGEQSFAIGYTTQALKQYSIAMGCYTVSSGHSSTAIGFDTRASGNGSTAMGQFTKATSVSSTAMGDHTEASGYYSTAMGIGTTASGYVSTATGNRTVASGSYSNAMGRRAYAVGDYSFAIHLNGTTSGPDVGDHIFRISGADDIGGNVGWHNWSDQRLKKDIVRLNTENNLAKIAQLNGVRFRWKDNDSRLNLGLIAQEVKDIVPECVKYDELNDIFSIEYTMIIPILIEGIKEQKKTIETQQSEIKSLQQQINELRELIMNK